MVVTQGGGWTSWRLERLASPVLRTSASQEFTLKQRPCWLCVSSDWIATSGETSHMTMVLNRSLGAAGTAASLIAAIALGPVATAAPEDAGREPSAAAQQEVLGNEVIVTAQRREQRLKDVGISVSVVPTEELRELNIE